MTLLLHVRKRCVTESFRMRLNAAFVDPMTLHWYAEDFITENSSLDRLKKWITLRVNKAKILKERSVTGFKSCITVHLRTKHLLRKLKLTFYDRTV